MTMTSEYRACVTIGALIAASLTLSGCLGPTYGTDKTATEQLMDDLGSIASIGQGRKGDSIEYKPRPEIVKPPTTASLPAPQPKISQDNPAWVESPEQTRARLVAEADANADSPNYRSPLAIRSGSTNRNANLTPEQQNQAFRNARKIQKGAYSGRRFLSDPPLAYRQPSETAPVGELGESELVKERRRIAEAKKAGTGGRKWWPW